jgi:hypothetical protein
MESRHLDFSLPFRGRAGVGASGASIAHGLFNAVSPHPDLPPEGEGARGKQPYSIVAPEACTIPFHFS